MVITIEDLRKNETRLCGSFLKMVDDVKAMATDPSEQQVLLTQMVLKDLMMNRNKPEAAFSLGFPKKKRSGSRGMQKQNQNQKQRIIIKFKRCVSATTGIASYSCSVSPDSGIVGSRGMQKQNQNQKQRIIIKFKRCVSATTGIASYSCSVSPDSGIVVNPDPLHDDQKQDLKLKLKLKSKKRCYSEIEQAGDEGFEDINSKRLRKGKNHKRVLPSAQSMTEYFPKEELQDCFRDHPKPRARAIAIAGKRNEIKINHSVCSLSLGDASNFFLCLPGMLAYMCSFSFRLGLLMLLIIYLCSFSS
ncbi:uncharacterized protein LOC112176028 isoform X2 [Rosa chinensis]|uniref:uncharacterized protein LOC112176028 isoform X2 n=1 Tax=Rosa chinensis TaxID=74649 RepID=UPI001AD8F68B|nr:uncharacterized protein LOC112176028 isoform X2 [Rosa chinensis]